MRSIVSAMLLLLCHASVTHAQLASPKNADDDAPTITLVTFGPGREVHQYFGHNALIVAGGDHAVPVVYNYGMFGFGPGMIPKFLRGRLEFWVGATALAPTFDNYVAANRDIRLIPLRLTAEQRRHVAAELERDASPEHRDYLYNHYDYNCSTRVRDVIDHALGGALKTALSKPTRFTLRDETRRYTQGNPLIEWLMMFGLNDSVDHPITEWQAAFLPDELERLVMALPPLAGSPVPLAGKRVFVHDAQQPPPPNAPATRWPWLLLMGLVSAAIAWWTGRRGLRSERRGERWAFAIVHGQLSFVLGLLGTLLLSLWLTDHVVAHANENLFLANPTPWVACACTFGLLKPRPRLVAVMRGAWLLMAASTLTLLVLKPLLPTLDQDVSMTLPFFAPINLAFAHVFWRARASAPMNAST